MDMKGSEIAERKNFICNVLKFHIWADNSQFLQFNSIR